MSSTYSITEAQANLPALVKEAAEHPVTITRRDKTVGYLVSHARMECILETLEILADPEAMAAIRQFEEGGTEFHSLDVLGKDD